MQGPGSIKSEHKYGRNVVNFLSCIFMHHFIVFYKYSLGRICFSIEFMMRYILQILLYCWVGVHHPFPVFVFIFLHFSLQADALIQSDLRRQHSSVWLAVSRSRPGKPNVFAPSLNISEEFVHIL